MSAVADAPTTQARHVHPDQPAMMPADPAAISDDDGPEPHDLHTHDAQSLVGVSIGHAQAHFISPATPAAEKAAAMDDLLDAPFGDAATTHYGLDGSSDPALVESLAESPAASTLTPKHSCDDPATPRR